MFVSEEYVLSWYVVNSLLLLHVVLVHSLIVSVQALVVAFTVLLVVHLSLFGCVIVIVGQFVVTVTVFVVAVALFVFVALSSTVHVFSLNVEVHPATAVYVNF